MRIFVAVRSEQVQEALGTVGEEYSPNIEVIDPSTIVFDLAGRQTERLGQALRGLRKILPGARIGVSDNLATALLLIRERPGLSVARRGQESDLGRLDISALEAGRDFTALMRDWAIDDLGSFAGLPEDEMTDRFGPEAAAWFRRARGEDFRAAGWNVRVNEFRWSKSFEAEIRSAEPLRFVLSTAVAQVFQKLERACLASQECLIDLSGGGATCRYEIRTIVPTRNEKLWLRLISMRIESHPPGFDIAGIAVEFVPSKPRSIQSDLFSGNLLEPEKIGLVATRIRRLVGDENVGMPRLLDSWRPRAFALDEDLTPLGRKLPPAHEASLPAPGGTFFYFPEPVRVKIIFAGSRPSLLILKGKKQRILASGGPWRVEGGWWSEEQWKRDEWDLQSDNGAVYRAFLGEEGEYFLEGGYD